jgi:disulfide bond formation protein DsbB
MNAVRFVLRWWTAFGLLAAIAMLATAHAFQQFGGLAPCHLCLKQRDVYWFAIAIAAPATLWALFTRSRGTPRVAAFCLFAVFATGAIVAFFHAGVELKWWPGPATCTGGGETSIDAAALKAIMGGALVRPPQCDVVAWTFAGLSMAGWNAIVSAVLAVVSLIASMRRKDARFGK